MATLTVKNVGPIREAEFEVKKHTVFIGPQGSGKSTLAKLIAIGGDSSVFPGFFAHPESLPANYNLEGYFMNSTALSFVTDSYIVNFDEQFDFELTEQSQKLLNDILSKYVLGGYSPEPFESYKSFVLRENQSERKSSNPRSVNLGFYRDFSKNFLFKEVSIYVPAERTLTAILSNAIWGLLYSETTLPKILTLFGQLLEQARNSQNQLNINFLQVRYKRENGQDLIYHEPEKSIKLSQSASGYQSIIPLLLVVEHQRRQARCRFIIEEPELNLYPTAQKNLIYSLMSGLQPDVDYQDAEWVITTHSPYVLSSFNTLMLAHKVAQRSEELRAEVEKIIPARCWINPDEFAAYYVDNGTVRSIISEKTGLIADNELDDVSEDLAGEQDQLLALSRSVSRA